LIFYKKYVIIYIENEKREKLKYESKEEIVMKVKMIVELSQEEMDEVKTTIQTYNMGSTPEELIMERVETDLWDYLDFSHSQVKVVD
jgi:hypothetical protein